MILMNNLVEYSSVKIGVLGCHQDDIISRKQTTYIALISMVLKIKLWIMPESTCLRADSFKEKFNYYVAFLAHLSLRRK